MIDIEEILTLSDRDSVKELYSSKLKIDNLNLLNSELLDIASDMFRVGSKSHLNSLNPLVREDLGYQLEHMTRADPRLQSTYKELKNRYLSLGKSYAAISYLFDLVDQEFGSLDVILMHELFMDDGTYRTSDITIQHSKGDGITIPADDILGKVEELFVWYNVRSRPTTGLPQPYRIRRF